jgi:transcriptional regulator with AAA-type ATPase domain
MFWRARSFWIAAGAVAYAAFAALQASGGRGPAWLALVGLPVLLALVWTATAPLGGYAPPRTSEKETERDPAALATNDELHRSAARICFTGAAFLAATRTGPDSPWLDALGNLGAAVASMASLVAVARIPHPGGLLPVPDEARRLDAAAFASLFWTIAVALPAAVAIAPERTAALPPLAPAYVTVAASLASLGVSLAALQRTRAGRSLELGTGDRTAAALWLTLTALGVSVLAAALRVVSPERLLPVTAAGAALAVAWSAVAREATAVARALRVILALTVPAAPIALFAVYIAYAAPGQAGAVAFLACAACAVLGLAAPLLARRFAPERARFHDALDAATEAAMNPDPDAALETALTKLQGLTPARGIVRATAKAGGQGEPHVNAVVYRLAPPELVTVDRAGYMHTEAAEVPPRLIDLASAEPEHVLRTDVLRAVEVRRPDVRPLLTWLEQRGIGAAALILDSSGPIGVLTVPRSPAERPMSLEEVRLLRALADRLGAVLGVSSMLARSRDRENLARSELEALRAEASRKDAALKSGAARFQALARILERPARAAAYSPPARAAIDQLENLAQTGRPMTLLTPPGVDAIAWAALAHLASQKRSGAFVIVDGASPSEHDLLRFRDPVESPLHIAAGGTLVILDAQALPLEVQSYLGAALAARRASPVGPAMGDRTTPANDEGRGRQGSEATPEGTVKQEGSPSPIETGFIVAVPATVDSLVAAGRLSERLADQLGDRAVALPDLASRAEDLRALSLDYLVRIGMRLRGRPLGLDLPALALLGEHLWPGNDAELYAVLLRAALAAEGDVIGARELQAIGFAPGERSFAGIGEPRKRAREVEPFGQGGLGRAGRGSGRPRGRATAAGGTTKVSDRPGKP